MIIPKAFKARERCLQVVQELHQSTNRYSKDGASANGDEVMSVFGSKQFRTRQKHFSEMEHMNDDAVASADLGLIWAWILLQRLDLSQLHQFWLTDNEIIV